MIQSGWDKKNFVGVGGKKISFPTVYICTYVHRDSVKNVKIFEDTVGGVMLRYSILRDLHFCYSSKTFLLKFKNVEKVDI